MLSDSSMPGDYEDEDEDEEWPEADAGPEYWMHKNFRPVELPCRCIMCGVKQVLRFQAGMPFGYCPNCEYMELF